MDTLDRIAYLVKEQKISEKDFLNDIGLNPTAFSDWKSGRSKSFTRHIQKIATYFDVSTDYLLGLTDVKKARSPESERANIDNKIIEIYEALPPEQKKLAEDYLEYLLSRQKKPKEN